MAKRLIHKHEDEDPDAGHAQLLIAVSSWCCCSVGMMVFNKLAIHAFGVPCALVAFQFLFTVFILVLPPIYKTIHIGSIRDVMRWIMVVPFFTGMILSSILALKYAPMTLVMTFRAMSPMLSLVIECFYPNPLQVSPLMLLALLGSFFGMWLYLYDMDKSNFNGMGWAVLNNFLAVGDRLLQRLMLGADQDPVDISKTGVTLLNNLFGMVPLLIAAFLCNEFPDVMPAIQALDGWGTTWVIASCLVAVGISYTGVWVSTMISATSFLVLINANKFGIVFLEAFVMREKSLGAMQIAGACVSIVAGIVYGKAREAVEKEAPPLLEGSESSEDSESINSSK